jgi:hypothetical protein
MTARAAAFSSIEEFWPFYLSQHSKWGNRAFHFAGTSAAILSVGAAAVKRRPQLLLAAVVLGYGLSWIGHYAIEKNRPATFGHPIWSLRCDFRMYGLMWRGKMTGELNRLVALSLSRT